MSTDGRTYEPITIVSFDLRRGTMSAKQVCLPGNYLVHTTGVQNLKFMFQSTYYKESLHILLKYVLIVN